MLPTRQIYPSLENAEFWAGTVEGRSVALGNATMMADLSIEIGLLRERLAVLHDEGQTVMLVAVDGRPAGLIGVADRIKASTPEAIRLLHAEGLRIIMVTGDSQRTALLQAAHKGSYAGSCRGKLEYVLANRT